MESIAVTNKWAVDRFWEVIQAGGIVVYPTDTLYGLGADSCNRAAVDRLISIKGRKGPFSVMLGSLNQIKKYALISPALLIKLSERLPGPFTFILDVCDTSAITPAMWGSGKKVGFRVPDHPFIRSAFDMYDRPIVTTSVNKTGQAAHHDPAAILVNFDGQVDLLIDGGVLPASVGSTVVDGTQAQWPVVRQGAGVL